MQEIVVEAPAKINLTLDVKGKRDDGYHELETVMHQIGLVDTIRLRRGLQGIRLGSNSRLIPNDEGNLAFRAAALLYRNFYLPEGLDLFIEKNIPVGAGLAGGSTDAAAVLTGMNQLFDLNIPLPQLLELGASIGSDVPFCIMGGTALAKGRGEILEALPTGPRLDIMIVKPNFQLSTAEVYRAFSLDKVIDSPDTDTFLAAWTAGDQRLIAREIKNVLETVSISWHPEIKAIKREICEAGALNAMMSGSGPTVFGIFNNAQEAQQAWQEIKKHYKEAFVVSSYR